MKSLFYGIIISLSFLLTAACSDDGSNPDDDNGTPNPADGKLTLTINGAAWQSVSAVASAIRSSGQVVSIGVAGTASPQFDTFAFGVANIGTGITEGATYTYAPGSLTGMSVSYVNPGDTTLTATLDPARPSGTIAITRLNLADSTVSGAFNFNLYRVSDGALLEIRNGAFTKIPISIISGKESPDKVAAGKAAAEAVAAVERKEAI